jgi:LCP family protein required for cell wall assembly
VSRNTSRTRKVLLVVSVVVSFLMFAGAAATAGSVWWIQAKLNGRAINLTEPVPSVSASGSPVPANGLPCKTTCNYLVLGLQQGQDTTDTMMLVHIVAATQHATILSIPRDLLVNVPGFGPSKINAAYGVGLLHGGVAQGLRMSAATVAELTGMSVNHVILVQDTGFKAIVQAVGGVPFCTPIPLYDAPKAYPLWVPGDNGTGFKMKAGCGVLTGTQALALVRSRSMINPQNGQLLDCVSDFARIQRQQQFLRALMNKVLSPSEFTKLPSVVDAAMKNLTFDSGMQVTDLIHLASALHGLASGNADFRTLPAQLAEGNVQGTPTWYLKLTSQGQQLLNDIRTGKSPGTLGLTAVGQAPSPADIAVRVYDDASQGHAQNDVWNAQLSFSGFKMMDTAAEPMPSSIPPVTKTTILYNPGFLEQAKVVANYVPGPYPIVAAKPGELPADTQVAVVVTSSYVHYDPGTWHPGPSTAVSCPYHATYQGSANPNSLGANVGG